MRTPFRHGGLALAVGLATCSLSAYGQSSPVITYPAGVYSVQFAVPTPFAGPFVISQTATSITISWGAAPVPPVPVPPTPPPPTPTPVPIPVSTPVYVAMVHDKTQTLPASQEALKTSTTISTAVKALNGIWACVDVASPVFTDWVAEAKAVGLPALMVINVDATNHGTKFEAVPLPASGEPGVMIELNRLRGH